MGNVVSASSKPIADAIPKFDPIQIDVQNESKQKKPLENPGTMEELHKKCKGEWLTAAIPRAVTSFLWRLSNRSIPTYEFFFRPFQT